MIKNISILGLRSFGIKQNITFAVPDKRNRGSGLTIITGSNNSGKTTIIESLRSFIGDAAPSFPEGARNKKTNRKVNIVLTDINDKKYSLSSSDIGGSSTNRDLNFRDINIYIVPSRRGLPSEFAKTDYDKKIFVNNSQEFRNSRKPILEFFEPRLFQIEKQKKRFDSILKNILGKDFDWCIEQNDSGRFYVKHIQDDIEHGANGVGDGFLSVFIICASLFDIGANDTIVIDEPELSLHPSLQKKLLDVLLDYSKDHQIIISTHSPYFIDWNAVSIGAKLIRVVKDKNNNSECYFLSENTIKKIGNEHNNINNPHVLGLDAKEVFFLEDHIILVEGQEDVVIFNKLAKELSISINGSFFGWGVGGAEKMEAFLLLFNDLGYKSIVVIFDGDKSSLYNKLKNKYHQ